MTWDRKNDGYLLKFCLNLYKKYRGIPSDANLDEEFLQDCSIPFTKRNVLSVACQFYDPTGLEAPLMFSVRSLFSALCRDRQCSMNSVLSEVRAAKFCTEVHQILRKSELSYPWQVVYHGSGQLFKTNILGLLRNVRLYCHFLYLQQWLIELSMYPLILSPTSSPSS